MGESGKLDVEGTFIGKGLLLYQLLPSGTG